MSNEIRLNKYLSEAGICSRREADRLIEAGKVTVDGTIADLGTRVGDSSVVTCNGKPVHLHTKKVIYAYNKPIGQVCTSKDADPDSIFRYVEFPERVNYVGRLDKDSTGLLLLTSDGDLQMRSSAPETIMKRNTMCESTQISQKILLRRCRRALRF